ncbi:hypothetical protein CPC08DRAFT_714123 [Agrocybe pediades]|nr:hypothetical protein CPC08DRAFT_714123 [Agrocybe pediades]
MPSSLTVPSLESNKSNWFNCKPPTRCSAKSSITSLVACPPPMHTGPLQQDVGMNI